MVSWKGGPRRKGPPSKYATEDIVNAVMQINQPAAARRNWLLQNNVNDLRLIATDDD